MRTIFVMSIAFLLFQGVMIAQIKNVQPAEVKELMAKGYEFIDVREIDEVKELAYGLENVKNLPLSELEARMGEFSKEKKYIVACRSGGRSLKAINMMSAQGYETENMYNLEGGMLKWQQSGLPVKDAAAQKAENCKNPAEGQKACCANPNSKKCNPDGTCKTKKNGKPYKQCKK